MSDEKNTPLTLVASSECHICGINTPHEHTIIERALYWKIEPVAEALCAASGHEWLSLEDEWPWPSGRPLCRDFFRWQARFALGLAREKDRQDEPQRNGLALHDGRWPLSEFERVRRNP